MRRARRASLPRGAPMWTDSSASAWAHAVPQQPSCRLRHLFGLVMDFVAPFLCFTLNPGTGLGVSVPVGVCRCEVCAGHGADAPSSHLHCMQVLQAHICTVCRCKSSVCMEGRLTISMRATTQDLWLSWDHVCSFAYHWCLPEHPTNLHYCDEWSSGCHK